MLISIMCIIHVFVSFLFLFDLITEFQEIRAQRVSPPTSACPHITQHVAFYTHQNSLPPKSRQRGRQQVSPTTRKLDCAPPSFAPLLTIPPSPTQRTSLKPVSKSHVPFWDVLESLQERDMRQKSAGYLSLLYPGYHGEVFCFFF